MITYRTHLALSLSVLVAAAGLAGCVVDKESNPKPKVRPATRDKLPPPTSVMVSPLTRIGIDPSGDAAIFLHLEFRDASNRSTKALGQLRAELFQPGAPAGAQSGSPQTLARSWDVDLRDPVRNALTFDELITHTYTINLTGIPEWLVHWARHEGDSASVDAPTLVVQFLHADVTSVDQAIRTTYTLTR